MLSKLMQCIEDCAESEKQMAVWVQSGCKWISCLPSWSCGCSHCPGSQDSIWLYHVLHITSLGKKIKIPSMVSTECVLLLHHLEVRLLKLGTLCRCCLCSTHNPSGLVPCISIQVAANTCNIPAPTPATLYLKDALRLKEPALFPRTAWSFWKCTSSVG